MSIKKIKFFQHFICSQFRYVQMNLQTPLIPCQNLNNFQLTPLNVSGDGLQPSLGLIGQILLTKIKI
jgi:hypothetical protein